MKDTDPMSRRSVLKITGVAGITTAIAGCGGGPGNGGGENESGEPAGEDPAEEEPAAGEEGGNETEAGNETEEGNETEGNETEGNETEGNETDEESAGGGEAIEPDTQIVLEAQTSGWVGVEPEEIADDENPTITLQQDESYEIGWEEGDGSTHNIELVDDNDEVVEDYETEESNEGGEDQFIEFDATDEIAEYVCRPHESTMRGEIELEEGGGNGGAMEGNETEGNETEEMGNETEGNETEDNATEDNESDE